MLKRICEGLEVVATFLALGIRLLGQLSLILATLLGGLAAIMFIFMGPFVLWQRHVDREELRQHEAAIALLKKEFPASVVGTVFRAQDGRISLAGQPQNGVLLEGKAPPLTAGDIVALTPINWNERTQEDVYRVTFLIPE